MLTYRYAVQTTEGQALDGVMRAQSVEAAHEALETSNLRVLTLELEDRPSGRPLRGTDFLAFNQQLAQLTKVGLPIASGLRLIAQDMRRGRLSESINRVVDELERGAELPEAFARHESRFPKLYSQLVAAGVNANRLSAVLMNLGRHLEMMQRLRGTLWRAVAYPLVVTVCFAGVMGFVGTVLIPQFSELYDDFDTSLPVLTAVLIWLADYTWPILTALAVAFVALPVLAVVLRVGGHGGWVLDHVLMRLPLIGPALNRNLMARWCDMLRVGVSAGLDLPAALQLSSASVGSRRLMQDTRRLIEALESGRTLGDPLKLSLIPASVPAAMQLASEKADLAALVGDLSAIYEQQADLRLSVIQAYLSPALTIVMGLVMGSVITALFLPLVRLMQSII